MKHNHLLAIVLFIGIVDSSYLTVVHFMPGSLYCPATGALINCENVLTSSFSTVFGIPLAALGLVWFIVSISFLLFTPNRVAKNLWMMVGAGGILYSITAQSIIGKICIYCASLDILIALSIGMFLYIKNRK
ncbi:MAG: vitamin K epoxide reductase family protein [Candidatus Micrarchaeales archaeon]